MRHPELSIEFARDGQVGYAQDALTAEDCVHTIIHIGISFDPAKNASNIASRGLSFERATEFDFQTAVLTVDSRHDYGETRMTAIGKLDDVLHVLIFTMREEMLRVISFRKANKREVRWYEKATQP